jgi:hypothetical protein
MPSVPQRPHPSAHVVVARSRRTAELVPLHGEKPGADFGFLLLALLLGLGAWPLEALAAPPGAAAVPHALDPARWASLHSVRPLHGEKPGADFGFLLPAPATQPELTAVPREESYRGLLTMSYVLAPFVALGVGHTLAEIEADDAVAAVGAGTMCLAPAVVHMAHGNVGHGPLAFLGLAASTAVGTVVGGIVGSSVGSLGCDPAEDSDGCDFAGINGLVIGALLGGVTGYTGFAIYDVLENGAVAVDDAPPPDRASLQLWLSPLPAARREHGEATTSVGGLLIGASLQM